MVAVRNCKHIFKKVPTGYPEPDVHTVTDSSDTIDLENVALNGGFLVKSLALSIDPYLRVKMRHAGDDEYLVCLCLCGGEQISQMWCGLDPVRVGRAVRVRLCFSEDVLICL
jgi:NADPH-dependent curcumin reductase CurA